VRTNWALITLFWAGLAQAVSVQDVLQQGLANDPVLQQRMAEVALAKARQGQAQSALRLQLNAQVELSEIDRRNSLSADQRYQGEEAELSLVQPLFDGPRRANRLRQGALVSAAESRLDEARNTVAVQILQAYGNWRLAGARESALDSEMQAISQQLRQVMRRNREGIGSQADVSLARVQQIEVQNRLTQARSERIQAQAALTYWMVDADWQGLEFSALEWPAARLPDIDPNRIPAVQVAQAELAAARHQASQLVARRLPTLNAGVALSRTNIGSQLAESQVNTTAQATLTLRMPILRGGAGEYEQAEAEQLIRQAQWQSERILRRAQQDILQIQARYEAAQRNFQRSDLALTQAISISETLRQAYEFNAATQAQYFNSLQRVSSLRLQRDRAAAEGFQAYIEAWVLTGPLDNDALVQLASAVFGDAS